MPVWPGSAGFRRIWTERMQGAEGVNISKLDCDIHVGTHIDAPLHFLAEGKAVHEIDLGALVGPAWVADVGDVSSITARVLEDLRIDRSVSRLLLKTRNSELWRRGVREFREDFVALTADAAAWVAERGLRALGVDYLSVQRYEDGPETHRLLLGAGIVIVEGLNLSGIDSGAYEFLCLPLKLIGAEGAPARAVLRPAPGR
jgi:arylformamidase